MYALDRNLIAQYVYQGITERADGTQPTLSPAYAPDRIDTIYTFDPDKANKLLDDAGWAHGDDGVRVKEGVRFLFECLYGEGAAVHMPSTHGSTTRPGPTGTHGFAQAPAMTGRGNSAGHG